MKNENFPEIPGIPAAEARQDHGQRRQEPAASAQDVLQNKADWTDDPPPADQLREVKEQYADRYEEHVTNSTYYFFLNQRVSRSTTPEVRKAVHYAIDKRALARLFGGQLEPGCNFLPPGMQGYEKIEPCPFGDPNAAPNVEEAKKIIQEAGVAGEKVTVWGNDEEPTKPSRSTWPTS